MKSREPADTNAVFLPDFCGIRTVFVVVLIAEMLAFVLTLATPGDYASRVEHLARSSLFIQWVALSCVALLCVSRGVLSRLGDRLAATVSYLSILAMTFLISELAWWVMQQAPVGDTSLQQAHAGFLLRTVGTSAIVSAVTLRYFYVQYQWKKNIESEAEARIQALQSRIRPHFLFNCMNTIASLTRKEPALAEQALEDLADLFRASLSDAKKRVGLAEELALCRRYLHIEGLRLGDRLQADWAIDELPGDALLPALTIQPLLDNAIYHGIQPLPEGGMIRIVGKRDGAKLIITIDNPLPEKTPNSQHAGNRLAQENVRQRLEGFYGKQGTLTVDSGNGRYRVCVSFPYQRAQDEDSSRR
ncbi:MAG: histidine kinase [Gammaproteobacteria bacterium]|nr:histidine kinase [Gammaproteobacteria bacterium]MCI0590590.1 histidine kinase [Gammaproteobacteria bacterium]